MDMVYSVFDFAQAMGSVKIGEKTAPETVALYKKLIHEEYQEFCEATEEDHELNEAMDLIWVILGYAICKHWDIHGAWEELTSANMAKLVFDASGNLRRRPDGKILKPEGWLKPNFKPFINPDSVLPI